MIFVINEMRIDFCVIIIDVNFIRRVFLFVVFEIFNIKNFLLYFKGVFVYKNVLVLYIINYILLVFL